MRALMLARLPERPDILQRSCRLRHPEIPSCATGCRLWPGRFSFTPRSRWRARCSSGWRSIGRGTRFPGRCMHPSRSACWLRSINSAGAPCRLRAANGLCSACWPQSSPGARGICAEMPRRRCICRNTACSRCCSTAPTAAAMATALHTRAPRCWARFSASSTRSSSGPCRAEFFEFRDIIINVLSVLLIQAGLAAGLATRCRAVPAGLRSARAAWRLAALVLLLLLGCFSNTPAVWHPLYSSRPNLFVFDEAMVQYGHRIHDPEVGWFKSRLTADQLRETDRARAEEAGEILQAHGAR